MESQSESTQTVSTLKLPMLKTRDYDLWSMKMEQYLTHTNYALWEVIMNGDAPALIASVSGGSKHLLKFHEIKDAKTLWEAIKTRSEELDKTYDSSTNEAVNTVHDVSTASSQGQASSLTYADDVMFSFFANQSNSPQLDNEDLEPLHPLLYHHMHH
ncbi:hypothetical protein Tco_0154491 [Tanacetum coccineum]